jgi:hypothetical protein
MTLAFGPSFAALTGRFAEPFAPATISWPSREEDRRSHCVGIEGLIAAPSSMVCKEVSMPYGGSFRLVFIR